MTEPNAIQVVEAIFNNIFWTVLMLGFIYVVFVEEDK